MNANVKKIARVRRSRRVRSKIYELDALCLSVHRTNQHMYAQITCEKGSKVVAHASTLDSVLKTQQTSGIDAATKVGVLIAERAKAAGVTKLVFDRSGFKYHGRIKALADAARLGGLEF